MTADSADAICRKMQRVRGYVLDDAGRVADAARSMTEWRTYVRQYPWVCLGGAALAGFLVVPRRDNRSSAAPPLAPDASRASAASGSFSAPIVNGLLAAVARLASQAALRAASNYVTRVFAAKKSHVESAPTADEGGQNVAQL